MSESQILEETYPSDEEFSDEEDSDSSTDVDAKLAEDDVFDIEFLKCYSALKKKDSKIYDGTTKFFNSGSEAEEDQDNNEGSSKKILVKPKMTLLDHQLKLKEEDIEEPKVDLTKTVSKSFYEKELEDIKKSIEEVCDEIDSDSDEELLNVKGEQLKDKKVIKNLLDKIEDDDDEDISHLRQIWSDPKKLTPEDKFLRDYILNKRYLPQQKDEVEDKDDKGFFSKNLNELSDVEEEDNEPTIKKSRPTLHSDEKGFEHIARIPRDSTKTIRDIVEKQEKKQKRLKKLEKEKKKKKTLKNADCEDIVGDLPTKFHYRETVPNDYGLSAEELILATDEELDQWVSLHETVAFKTEEEELELKSKFEKKRHDLELKKKIFKSIYGEDPTHESVEATDQPPMPESARKKNKRKRNKSGEGELVVSDNNQTLNAGEAVSEQTKKKKKKRRGLNHKKFAKAKVAPDRLLAYGLSKTKLKRAKLL